VNNFYGYGATTKDKSNEGITMKYNQQIKRLLKKYHRMFDAFGNKRKKK
jgi:hypothetical protein